MQVRDKGPEWKGLSKNRGLRKWAPKGAEAVLHIHEGCLGVGSSHTLSDGDSHHSGRWLFLCENMGPCCKFLNLVPMEVENLDFLCEIS